MPTRNLVRAFLALWWTVGLLLFLYSVRTVIGELSVNGGGAHSHVAILAAAEAIAALLFLLPHTMRAGGIGLLVVFLLAFTLHALRGEFASQLLLYAAAVTFIVVHGPPPAPDPTDRPLPRATS